MTVKSVPFMQAKSLSRNLQRIAHDSAELPGLRLLAKPAYRLLFARGRLPTNSYYGLYASFAEALADAPKSLPTGFDLPRAASLYRERLESILMSDYAVIFWLSRLLMAGQRKLFDLGGHIGISYYGFQRYLTYPNDLQWQVYDVPEVVSAGRTWASQHDPAGRLSFTQSRGDADGCDMVLASGVLQYLSFTLSEMLLALNKPPRHLLINVTPLHPKRSFFTLQRIGFSVCPYRVAAIAEFVAGVEALGYRLVDRWESFERYMRIPFESDHSIDRYHGFYFRID
jgi:putative methyltransferase (TIGR04325 family)